MSQEYRKETENKYRDEVEKLLEGSPDYVRQFYDYMGKSREASTQNRYVRDVLFFIRYVHDVIPECNDIEFQDMPVFVFESLTTKDMVAYQKYLDKVRFLSNGTIKKSIAAVSAFYRFLNASGASKSNPIINLDVPKVNRKKLVKLDSELSNRLLTGILRNDMYLEFPEHIKNEISLRTEALKKDVTKRRKAEFGMLPDEFNVETDADYQKELQKLIRSYEDAKVPVPVPDTLQVRRQKSVLRNFTITALFLGSGLRVSELVGLDTDDVSFRNNSLTIVKKGGDDTEVYFNDDVKDILGAYMNGTPLPVSTVVKYLTPDKELRQWCYGHIHDADFENGLKTAFPGKPESFYGEARILLSAINGCGRQAFNPKPNEKALFLSNRGTRMTVRMVELMIKETVRTYLPDYEDKDRFTPHKLRATCATRILTQTGDIEMASTQLNHANISTTSQFYAELKKERRKDAIKKLDMSEW